MKTRTHLLMLLLLTFGLVACSSDDDDIYNSDLIGVWEWESTGGGQAFSVFETPTTQQRSVEIHIESDQSFTIFENEIEVATGSYQIEKRLSTLTEERERFITATINTNNSLDALVYEGIINTYDEGTRLVIQQDFMEGVKSVFKKM